MPGLPFYSQVLASQLTAAPLFNAYTVAKTVINPTELITIPRNLLRIGSKFRIRASGALSSAPVTPGTVSFQIMMGPISTIPAYSTGPVQLNTSGHTLLPWWLDLTMRCDTIGAGTTAKFFSQGTLAGVHFTRTLGQSDNINTPGDFVVPATAPAVGTGFDSTVDNVMDFWTGFSVNNVGNGVQVFDYLVEQLQG